MNSIKILIFFIMTATASYQVNASSAKRCADFFLIQSLSKVEKNTNTDLIPTTKSYLAAHKGPKVSILDEINSQEARKVLVSPTGQHMIVATEKRFNNYNSRDTIVEIIDLQTNKVVETANFVELNWHTMAWSPEGKRISYNPYNHYGKFEEGAFEIYHLKSDSQAKPRNVRPSIGDTGSSAETMRWSPNGDWVTSSYGPRGFKLIEARSGKVDQVLEDVHYPIWHLDSLLFFVDTKGRIWKYNPATREKDQVTSPSDNPLMRVAEKVMGTKTFRSENELMASGVKNKLNSKELVITNNQALEKAGLTQNGKIVLQETTWPSTLLRPFQREESKGYKTQKKLHGISPDGQWLVTSYLTGRSWDVRRATTEKEKLKNEQNGYVSETKVVNRVHEMEVQVINLVDGRKYSFKENYVKGFYGASLSERFNLVWMTDNSFALGRSDGGFKTIRWALDENNQQKIIRDDEIVFSDHTGIQESLSAFVTNDGSLLFMSLNKGTLKLKSMANNMSWSTIEIPLSELLAGIGVRSSELAQFHILGVSENGNIILDFLNANVGGSSSHILKVEIPE